MINIGTALDLAAVFYLAVASNLTTERHLSTVNATNTTALPPCQLSDMIRCPDGTCVWPEIRKCCPANKRRCKMMGWCVGPGQRCNDEPCLPHQLECSRSSFSFIIYCYDKDDRCDGYENCQHGEDESGCPRGPARESDNYGDDARPSVRRKLLIGGLAIASFLVFVIAVTGLRKSNYCKQGQGTSGSTGRAMYSAPVTTGTARRGQPDSDDDDESDLTTQPLAHTQTTTADGPSQTFIGHPGTAQYGTTNATSGGESSQPRTYSTPDGTIINMGDSGITITTAGGITHIPSGGAPIHTSTGGTTHGGSQPSEEESPSAPPYGGPPPAAGNDPSAPPPTYYEATSWGSKS